MVDAALKDMGISKGAAPIEPICSQCGGLTIQVKVEDGCVFSTSALQQSGNGQKSKTLSSVQESSMGKND